MTEQGVEIKKEARFHLAFEISLVLKGLNGTFEIVLGVLLLIFHGVAGVVLNLAENELIEDPADFIASHIFPFVSTLAHAQTFAALYLLSHGILKLVIVIGLLLERRWAFPVGITFLSIFILYQTFRIFETHSVLLTLLTLFDCAVLWLVVHEYHRHRHRA